MPGVPLEPPAIGTNNQDRIEILDESTEGGGETGGGFQSLSQNEAPDFEVKGSKCKASRDLEVPEDDDDDNDDKTLMKLVGGHREVLVTSPEDRQFIDEVPFSRVPDVARGTEDGAPSPRGSGSKWLSFYCQASYPRYVA